MPLSRPPGEKMPGATSIAAPVGRYRAAATDTPAGENPRRPCPCGSGKKYKHCHGKYA